MNSVHSSVCDVAKVADSKGTEHNLHPPKVTVMVTVNETNMHTLTIYRPSYPNKIYSDFCNLFCNFKRLSCQNTVKLPEKLTTCTCNITNEITLSHIAQDPAFLKRIYEEIICYPFHSGNGNELLTLSRVNIFASLCTSS